MINTVPSLLSPLFSTAFGFCEYKEPESTLRALRLLHELQIGEKKLLVKVDAKTKAQLDEWKAKKKSSTNGNGVGSGDTLQSGSPLYAKYIYIELELDLVKWCCHSKQNRQVKYIDHQNRVDRTGFPIHSISMISTTN